MTYLREGEAMRPQALMSTLYRVARYFGVLERLYEQLGVVKLENYAGTRTVSTGLNAVGKAFATDEYGPQFMLWREQQRAIGERMQRADGRLVGYAEFFETYDARFAPWLAGFASGLVSGDRGSWHLARLQEALAGLAAALDPAHADTERDRPDEDPERRAWWTPEMYAPLPGQ